MRSITLERDDSIFPFSALFSIGFHALLFFMIVIPAASRPPISEHIYATTVAYQVFPGSEKFLRFSDKERLYSNATEGLSEPTSGNVGVDPKLLTPSRALPTHGTPDASGIEAISTRTFYGNHEAAQTNSVEATGQVRPSAAQYNGGIDGPRLPDGTVEFWEDGHSQTLGVNRASTPGGAPGALRSGSDRPTGNSGSEGRGARGVINVPGQAQRLSPTTPQGGNSTDPRLFAEPVPTGNNVAEVLRGAPRPGGSPEPSGPRPSYGTRQILYKPLPEYPEWAELDNVQATPQFDVTVGSDGRVSKVRIAVSSGYTDIDRRAEEAVRRWIYEPHPGQTEIRRAVVRFVLKKK